MVLFCLTATPSHAKEEPGGLNQTSLQSLARSFVAKIGGGLKAYDARREQETRNADPMAQIPDGETLLLRPKSGDFIMQTDIAAIKHNNKIYYDFEDLITQLELPIDYTPDKKIGSGWFLREDWLIRFDFNKGEVVSRNESYQVQPEETYYDAETLYISASAAQKWMSIEMNPDIQQQYVEVKTPFPYPALARNARGKRGYAQSKTNAPVLPRLKAEEKMFDINTLETQQNLRVVKSEDKKATTSYRTVTSAQGDLFRHNFYGVGFWDKDEQLTSLRARFSKDDEDPVLLGGLKARYYGFGDIDTTQVPLAGGTTQELGFRVNNNPLRNADFQTTTISGDSLPGWDVELYRDGAYLARQNVDDSARYEFEDIQLYAGDNLFEVFFYGPQGEIRSDKFNIPVNQDFLATQDNTYDVSVSFKDTQTYNKFSNDSEDVNTPVVSARYNKYIGKTLTYAGLSSSQINGTRKAYVAGGFTHLWNGYIFDGNVAIDEKAATAEELTIRKNIAEWRIILNTHARSEDYVSDGDTVNLLGFNGTATKNFSLTDRINSTVTFDADYKKTSSDASDAGGGVSLSTQMGRFSLTNMTKYREYETGTGVGTASSYSRIDDSVSVRYNIGKLFLRAGLDYNIHPDSEVERYFGEATYYNSNKFNTNLTVQNDPIQKYTQAQLNVNYIHDKFRLTPYANIDTNRRMEAGLRLSTSLVDDPNKVMPFVTGQRMAGRGQVSAFVFHDKNGNNLFDGNDEPIPDAIVESVNVTRRVKTDETGHSLIHDLPENYPTDIRLDESSLPDPFMVSGFAGVSILPHAGQMVDLTFPVHMAGEITGSVFVHDMAEKTEAGRMRVELIPVDGKSTKVTTAITAEDGYYELSTVRPGNYLLVVNPQDADREEAGGAVPKAIRIGYEGTTLSSEDFELQHGRRQVAVNVENYKGTDFNRPFFAMDTGAKDNRSHLATLLEKMVERKFNVDAGQGLSPIAVEGHENLKVLSGADWNAHYNRCQQLNDDHIPCKLILFVPGTDAGEMKTAQK